MDIASLHVLIKSVCHGRDLLFSNTSTCICLPCVPEVSLQSRDRIGTGGPVVDCSRLFDNDLPDGWARQNLDIFHILSAAANHKQHMLSLRTRTEIIMQKVNQNTTSACGEIEQRVGLAASAHRCVCVCFCCQLGGEENCVWTDPVLEPHHTHHTVGEANQVSALCYPRKLKPRPLSSNSTGSVEDLIPDLSAFKLESPVEHWSGLPKKKGVRQIAPDSEV